MIIRCVCGTAFIHKHIPGLACDASPGHVCKTVQRLVAWKSLRIRKTAKKSENKNAVKRALTGLPFFL